MSEQVKSTFPELCFTAHIFSAAQTRITFRLVAASGEVILRW